ncbi:MAG TPA: hypothetical protein VH370_26335 [Humisphaera sp.]|jgi:hypothetical protein|nr:hypothetical protein [Humisphaera sp.]
MSESDTGQPTGISGGSESQPAQRAARPALPPGALPPKVVPPPPEPMTAPVRLIRPAPGSVRPAAPARPAAPPLLRPAVPQIPAPTVPVEQPQPEFAVNDDDLALFPGPTEEFTSAGPSAAVQRSAERRRTQRSMSLRRTFIPILLTLGVILIAAAFLRSHVSPDAPLSTVPRWLGIAGYAVGAALLAVAGVNMMQVRAAFARAER